MFAPTCCGSPASLGIAAQIRASAAFSCPGRLGIFQNGQLAFCRLVDEMQFQIEGTTRKQMLARVMEMELQQVEGLACDHRAAAGRAIDLDPCGRY